MACRDKKKTARAKHQSWVWYLISAPGRQRQQDHEFKASLGYLRSCFTKSKTKQNKQHQHQTNQPNKNKKKSGTPHSRRHASVLSWSVFHIHFCDLEIFPDPAPPHAVVWHLDRELELYWSCVPSASQYLHAIPSLHPWQDLPKSRETPRRIQTRTDAAGWSTATWGPKVPLLTDTVRHLETSTEALC